MIRHGTALWTLLLVVGCACGLAGETEMKADFFVAPDGSDAGPGTKEKPFATLSRARDAVRELKKGGLDRDLTVLVRGGAYWLKEPLAFGPEDSGTEKFSITYAAAPGERPVLSGGRPITGWKQGEGQLWTVELPEVKAGKWYFRQLFVNGRRAVRARSPNDGFFRVAKAGPDNRTSFTFKRGDLRAFRNIEDAELLLLHDWSVSRVRLKAVDEAAEVVSFADPIGCASADFFAIAGFEPNARYAVENAPELLDSPGEWYLDRRTGLLSYWPLAGEDPAKAEAVAPVLSLLLGVRGEAGKARRLENLRFAGLTLAHCEFPLPEHGYAEIQAGVYEVRPNPGKSWAKTSRNPAAVVFENTARCRLEDCAVAHAGTSGVSLEGAAEGNRITGCQVHDLGGNGIMVGGGENKPEGLAKDNVVANNHVHHCAQAGHGCVGVWAGLTEGTVIAHNEICDLPYTGVSVGWQWDTKPSQCQGNVVEFNHIHRVMQMLSDGGGIYTLGRQPGTVLRGNLIHDVPVNAGRAESNGMFLDEGSSEFVVEGNTIYGVAKAPIRFHKATGLTIRKNALFTSGGGGPFTFNACEEKAMTCADNAVTALPRLSAREAGRVGRALACDGSSVYEEVPHSADLEPALLTLEAWVKLPEHPSGDDPRRWVAGKNANEWQQGHYALVVSGRNVGAYLNIGGGRENCFEAWSTTGPLKLNQWQHLAMTYDGAALKVYLDGEPVGSKPIGKPRVPGGAPLAIGRRPDGYATGYFRGAVDEVRLYKRAATAVELKRHAADPEKAPGAEAGLVGRWGFDEAPAGSEPEAIAKARAAAGPQPAYRPRLLEGK